MAGRKRAVPLNTLYELFEENEENVVCDNKVVPPSNTIWVTIHKQVERKSTTTTTTMRRQ